MRSGPVRCFGPALAWQGHEVGWKDAVQAHPGIVARVIVRFGDFTGRASGTVISSNMPLMK